MPGEAENNLNAAELRTACLAQVCSSTAQRMLSPDRGTRSSVSPGLACMPWSCPPVLCLQLSGSEPPCLGWDSISCNQAHLSFRALPCCARREGFPSLQGQHRQSKQVSAHPARQSAVFYMNGGQERCHKFSQFSCVGSTVGSELHPVS